MTSDNNWKPCEPGTIQDVARQQQQADRQDSLTRRAVFTSVLVGGAGIAFSAYRRVGGGQTSLNCRQACGLADEYHRHELNARQTAQVDAHLAHCGKCGVYFQTRAEALQA